MAVSTGVVPPYRPTRPGCADFSRKSRFGYSWTMTVWFWICRGLSMASVPESRPASGRALLDLFPRQKLLSFCMVPCVIFEDEHLLAVHKPAGWNTHAPGPFAGEGIYDWL